MRRFISFLKHYWFGILTSLILFAGFFFFLLVLVSPRQDAQKRGFIPCTEAMAQGMLSCPVQNKYSCMFGYILKNSWCDIKVIGRGMKLWVAGEQKAPWSNYIFTPILDEDNPEDEVLQEFRENNPHLGLELEYMKKLNQQLEETGNPVALPPEVEEINNIEENISANENEDIINEQK